jgi:hypothetical protein
MVLAIPTRPNIDRKRHSRPNRPRLARHRRLSRRRLRSSKSSLPSKRHRLPYIGLPPPPGSPQSPQSSHHLPTHPKPLHPSPAQSTSCNSTSQTCLPLNLPRRNSSPNSRDRDGCDIPQRGNNAPLLSHLNNSAGLPSSAWYQRPRSFSAAYFLTFLLLETAALAATEENSVRVIWVSSSAHLAAPNDGVVWDDINLEHTRQTVLKLSIQRYAQSKAMNVMLAYHLAALYGLDWRGEGGIVSLSLHPGAISTG